MSETQAEQEPTIAVFGLEDRGDRSFLRRSDARVGRAEVPVRELGRRVESFLDSMRQVITDLPSGFGDFAMDSVMITAEITAKGQVSLLGTGAEMAGKGGITFTFQRPPRRPPAAATPVVEDDDDSSADAEGDDVATGE